MPNILLATEDFTAAPWTTEESLIVVADTHAPPGFAGWTAGKADTLEDANAAGVGGIRQDVSVPDDTTTYVASVYVRKHPDVVRFPAFMLEFRGAVTRSAGIEINTATGAIADIPFGSTTPIASGIVDVDSEWWRVWWTLANDGLGNNVCRLNIWPALAAGLGGSFNSASVGVLQVWGANVVASGTVGAYEANPPYTVVPMTPFLTSMGR